MKDLILHAQLWFAAFCQVLPPNYQLGLRDGNEVVGTPEVQCTEDAITFSVRTAAPFRGNIYVKGHYGVDGCRQEYYGNDFAGATFVTRIGDCGMRRIRQLQPHGMNYVLTFVTNFHPHFMTKVDRAYNVRCFYAYIDKAVNTDMEVSNLPSESLEQQAMLMPECEYSIREATPDGPRIRTSIIGASLVHRWDCRTNGRYGILVRNCNAIDNSGLSIPIIDDRGCPEALPVQLRPVVYDPSLSSAYMVVEAFVFPDRSNVQFQCQVQICDRRDNECLGVTPPNCPMMTRNEFLPTSIIEASVNPTQVLATFEGTLQTAIGNAILDEDLRLPAYAPEFETAYPWRKEQDEMGEDSNSTESSQSSVALETPSVEARQTTLKMLTTEPTPEEASDDRDLLTQTNQLDWTIPQIPEIGEDHPLEIFVRSTSATPIFQSERSGRRLADQIIDVMSEELTLRTADDPPSREAARLPPTSSATQLTCLNQTAVLAMCAAFAMTIVLSIVLLLYILRDVCRGWQLSNRMEHHSTSSVLSGCSSNSNDSIDRRSDLPIFARRLGDPNYSMATRNY
uniref:ZP domain-containing protein n=1 Tax=Haemonchus contortus TaxID=6289 RepID=A0A7I4XXU4_HAECO